MASFSLFLCLFGSLTVTFAAGCSSPYVYIRGVKGSWCIHVDITAPSDGPGRTLSWDDSRLSCQATNGDLIVLDHDAEDKLQAISKYIDDTFPVETNQGWVYWVGASSNGGQWQWVDSTPVNLRSNIWIPDHPTSSSSAVQYARLVPADQTHGRRYLIASDGISPAHICETH